MSHPEAFMRAFAEMLDGFESDLNPCCEQVSNA